MTVLPESDLRLVANTGDNAFKPVIDAGGRSKISFTVQLSNKNLEKFNLYHTYQGVKKLFKQCRIKKHNTKNTCAAVFKAKSGVQAVGQHRFTAIAKDALDNQVSASIKVTVKEKNTPPNLSLNYQGTTLYAGKRYLSAEKDLIAVVTVTDSDQYDYNLLNIKGNAKDITIKKGNNDPIAINQQYNKARQKPCRAFSSRQITCEVNLGKIKQDTMITTSVVDRRRGADTARQTIHLHARPHLALHIKSKEKHTHQVFAGGNADPHRHHR